MRTPSGAAVTQLRCELVSCLQLELECRAWVEDWPGCGTVLDRQECELALLPTAALRAEPSLVVRRAEQRRFLSVAEDRQTTIEQLNAIVYT